MKINPCSRLIKKPKIAATKESFSNLQTRYYLVQRLLMAISASTALTPIAFSDTLIGWDIPTSTATSALISGTPVSGLSGTSITLGSGLSSSSSSTSWRLTSLNNTTSFDTATTGANATNDFFQWSVTTSARTTAAITGGTGFLWTASGTGPSTSAQLWVSTNAGSTWAQVGSSATLGASEVNLGNSWFNSTYNIPAGTTAVFRAAPLGATGGASSPKIAWNSGSASTQDVTLTGTTGGGAYNLIWNGSGSTVTSGQSGQFTGTNHLGSAVTNPTFESGDNITIGQSGTMNVNAAGLTVGTLTDSNASGNSTLAGGNITAASLNKTGAGTLSLSGNNSFSGGGSITSGTVVAGSSGALGNSTMTLNGGLISVTNSAVTSLSVPLSIGSSGGTVDNANDLTLSGAISGASNTLTKTGTGKLSLTGTLGSNKNGVAISFNSGSLDLSGSAKEFGGTSTLNGNVTATSTTLNLSQSSIINGTGTLSINGGTVATVFGSTGGSSTINKDVNFSNSVALTGASGKSLKFDTGTLSGSGTLTTSGSGGVQLNSTAISTYSGNIVNSTLLTASAQSLAAVSAVSTSNNFTIDNKAVNTGATVAANITGTGAVFKTSDGDVNLTGTNDFSGGLTLTAGGVLVNAAAGLGTGTITAANANSKVGLAADSGSSVSLNNAVNTGTLSSSVMAFLPTTSKTITLNGAVSGNGVLKVSGGGDLVVANSANSYSGGTEIGTGRVLIANDAALGLGTVNFGTSSNSYLVATGNLTSSRAFTLSGSSYTANINTNGSNVSLSGVISAIGTGGNLNKLGAGTLSLSNTNTYSGTTTISSGTLEISAAGSINNSSGITLNGGTFKNNSSVALIAPLTINNGTIGGTNFSGVALNIGTNQLVSPGNSPGTMSAGATTFSNGGTYIWEINNATGTAGTNWDLLTTPSLSLAGLSSGGFTVSLTTLSTSGNTAGQADNFNNTLSQNFLFVDAATTITSFAGTAFTVDSSAFQNTHNGTWSIKRGDDASITGGDDSQLYVSYTTIPEPAACGLLLGIGAIGLILKRRRWNEA